MNTLNETPTTNATATPTTSTTQQTEVGSSSQAASHTNESETATPTSKGRAEAVEVGDSKKKHGRHLNRCLKNPNRKKEKGQPSLLMPPPKPGQDGKLIARTYNYDRLRRRLVEWIIMDEIPFRKVEGSGFVALMQEAQPRFKNWKLQKRILLFCQVEGHTCIAIGEKLVDCLEDWGLKDIFGVTLDNVSANTVAMDHLKQVVTSWTRSPIRAKYLHIDKDFQERFIFEQDKESVLPSDADIEEAIASDDILEEVVEDMEEDEEVEDMEEEVNKKKKKKVKTHAPYAEDWSYARGLVKCLKVFFDATVNFSASTQVTTHSFLWELVFIHEQLIEFR
ncbi:uncharacterized protein LOC113330476 [Papaver somniferum]|uniref:uncharacterized protein LOC113330476 n=1 Tax=Papaver somniferum TaxID=3469 RepID=UPI000E6FA0B2|nr:uncharacterized protein LOC113330476 [Papaver somniferum]